MKLTGKRICALIFEAVIALALTGCSSQSLGAMLTASAAVSRLESTPRPIPPASNAPGAAYLDAQATLDAGKSQLLDLSRKETETMLDLTQAANAMAQATSDSIQRQKVDLEYQATIVSLNMTQAAATQNSILQQTKIAGDATAAAQNSTATAAQAAYLFQASQTAMAQAALDRLALQTAQAASTMTAYPMAATQTANMLNVTGTAEARTILNGLATQTGEAAAALTAYPLTATPAALTKEAAAFQEFNQEQGTFQKAVVDPLTPFLVALVIILFIGTIFLVFRRTQPGSGLRRLRLLESRGTHKPLIVDGVIIEQNAPIFLGVPLEETVSAPPPEAGLDTLPVEIIDPGEMPVAYWIQDAEDQLENQKEPDNGR